MDIQSNYHVCLYNSYVEFVNKISLTTRIDLNFLIYYYIAQIAQKFKYS